ncbi:MAG: hypothetical protein ACPGUV_08665, partial [Polyangiales bacterium]
MDPPVQRDAVQPSLIRQSAWVAALLVGQLVVTKTVRDALFLSHFGPQSLAWVMGASCLLSVGVVWLQGRCLLRLGPVQLVPRLLLLHALLYAIESAVLTAAPRLTALAVYLHSAGAGAAAVSAFWSRINEAFDPQGARQAVTRVGEGAALGGVVAGIAMWQLARMVPLRTALLVAAALNLWAALLCRRWGRAAAAAPERPAVQGAASMRARGLWQCFRQQPLLGWIAALVVLMAVGETLTDYVLKAAAQRVLGSAPALATF